MSRPAVVLVSNDVVPGMAMPVAAPGLRVLGIREGLRAHGFDVTTVVMRGPATVVWRRGIPPTAQPGTVLLHSSDLGAYLQQQAPAVVVLTNSNQVDNLRPTEGLRFVFDFFAPKMLELICDKSRSNRAAELEALRERKLRGIELAQAFIVNGYKKVPYFLAWLMQSDHDVLDTPLETVFMPVPGCVGGSSQAHEGLRFAMAGYLQGWSLPGEWLERLVDRLDAAGASLDVLMPVHWGQSKGLESPRLEQIRGHRAVRSHGAMTFGDFQEFMCGVDVAVDLFGWTLEREYATVTRSIVAVSCGVAVVHPPFTEVSPLIAEYEAGWLVDPEDMKAVDRVFGEILADAEEVRRRAGNARRLWSEHFDPQVATRPLVDIINRLGDGRDGGAQ
jgi:hypothetical protein